MMSNVALRLSDTLNNKKNMTVLAVLLAAVFAALVPALSHAFTAPASGSFGYDLYDIGVNNMLKGAPGFVGGVIAIAVSAMKLSQNVWMAVTGILGGTALLKADDIVSSMGFLI